MQSQRTLLAGRFDVASVALFALAVAMTTPVWAQSGNEVPAASHDPTPVPSSAPSSTSDEESVKDIIVTGSRISRSGFTAPTPVAIMTNERLEQLAITNVGDGLNLNPAFRAGSTPTTAGLTFGSIGSRLVDLRGLGATRTLVLLDGRRFVSSTAQATVDLNTIPSIILQRTEVVTGGASAAYGSDAVAGVVNIIMDTRFVGLKANAEFGTSRYGDGNDYQLAGAWGTEFAGGRGHFVIAGEFEDSKSVGDCYTRAWCAEERQELTTPAVRPAGVPARIVTTNVHASTQTRGGLITSGPFTGTQFAPDGTPTPFTYGQYPGTLFMIGGSGAGQNPYTTAVYIKVPVERYTGYAHASYDFSDSLSGFVEANYAYVNGLNLGGNRRDAGSLTIKTDNPFIPQLLRDSIDSYNASHPTSQVTSFRFGRESADLGPAYGRDQTTTYRFVGGLNGKLGGGFTWDAYYQFGRSDFSEDITNNPIEANWNFAVDAVLGPNGLPTCRSTLSNPTNGCAPLNLFGENKISDAARNYVTGTTSSTRKLTSHVAAANIQGEPFSTWAGPVSVAVGGEYRSDKVVGTADPVSLALGFTRGNGTALNGRISVYEGYLETVVPLAKDLPFAQSIEFNGAIRRTHYSTAGNVTTWKAGLVWELNDWLRFRGTKSRDIRAPNLAENFSPETQNNATINDSKTSSQNVVPTRSGGNAGLDAEKADTLTAGIVLSPGGALRGLHVSVDYYRIEVEDAIGSLTPQTIVTQCNIGNSEFCPLVTRDTAGFITLVRSPFLNLNTLQTDGVDIVTQYTLPLTRLSNSLPGTFNFNFNATYIAHLKTVQATGSTDIAGVTGCSVTSFFQCVPHWTLDGTVNYSVGRFSITGHGHYIPKSIYDPTLVGPEDAGYNPALPNSVNSNRVDGRFYMSLAAQVDVVKSDNHLIQIYGSIDNLFNTDPPLMPGRANNTFFDPVGRYYHIGVRVKY